MSQHNKNVMKETGEHIIHFLHVSSCIYVLISETKCSDAIMYV